MYETAQMSLPRSIRRLFFFLLSFYPKEYKKKYGEEMYLLFQDIYQEELEKFGHVSFTFWAFQALDLLKGIIGQHLSLIAKKGMKKYLKQNLKISNYNVISGILLLPIFMMTFISFIYRIVQGDFIHYNRPLYAFFSHTFLYYPPVLFVWVIAFPLLAALISFIPLLMSILKRKTSIFSVDFLKKNIITIGLILIGFGFVAMIRLHDFLPCVFYGFTHFGFGQINHIISVCRNA